MFFFCLVPARTRFGKKHFRLLWFQDSISPISFSLVENLMQLRLRFLEHIYLPPLSIFSCPGKTFSEHISGIDFCNIFFLRLCPYSGFQKGFHCSNSVQDLWTKSKIDSFIGGKLILLKDAKSKKTAKL